jgi:hypothetical protein
MLVTEGNQPALGTGGTGGARSINIAAYSSNRLRIVVATCALPTEASVSAAVLDIKTLSTRPDRGSGGKVLAQGTRNNNAAIAVWLNDTDVTTTFRFRSAPSVPRACLPGVA